jgi:hypothetical protein
MSIGRRLFRVARWGVAAVAVVSLADPSGAVRVATWVANHDVVDIPYVRDCHGIFRHPQECPNAVAAKTARAPKD